VADKHGTTTAILTNGAPNLAEKPAQGIAFIDRGA